MDGGRRRGTEGRGSREGYLTSAFLNWALSSGGMLLSSTLNCWIICIGLQHGPNCDQIYTSSMPLQSCLPYTNIFADHFSIRFVSSQSLFLSDSRISPLMNTKFVRENCQLRPTTTAQHSHAHTSLLLLI